VEKRQTSKLKERRRLLSSTLLPKEAKLRRISRRFSKINIGLLEPKVRLTSSATSDFYSRSLGFEND